ncbi:hypothetical protein CSW98_06405 [Vibrio sp. HA2012]|uniref:LysR family transcriptional regulator n=1 Tax=Vibrio sp. HA2012 TaxID=1971595 RepID=UPI000C2C0D82|nr:LysR family transcriptional regulator [Vibrio sp. HA2012]PJC86629.1 hypothetical protein CSW98_06405 [Vibrio sp. HA2012]
MFKLLTQFKVVGEVRNITKASKIIGISQPTLTQNLTRLEKSLGTTLLTRNISGIELTETGEKVYQNLIGIIDSYDNLISSIKNPEDEKRKLFTIGCGFNWTHTDFFKQIKKPLYSYNDLTFKIKNGDIVSLHDDLLNNNCDIAMGTIPDILVQHEEISYIPVFRTRFIIYVDKNHPLLSKPVVSDDDLQEYQWVILRHNNEPPVVDNLYNGLVGLKNIQFNCQSVLASLSLVQDSNNLTILSVQFKELAEQYGLAPLPTASSSQEHQVGLMFRKGNTLAHKISHEMIACIDKKDLT